MLVSNNIMLSPTSLLMNSSGAAFMHNLFAGTMNVVSYDARLTPYHKPHSTEVVKLNDNPSGDIRFINNLFVKGGSSKGYDTAMLTLTFNGNVYLKGSEISKQDKQGISKPDFDADVNLVEDKKGMFLEINLDKSWLAEQKRTLVSTENLGKAIIPDLPFENTDGTPVYINTDWTGKKRNSANPSPGPFEIIKSGKQKIKVID